MITKNNDHDLSIDMVTEEVLSLFEVSCDNCSTGEAEYKVKDWAAVKKAMKEDGWSTKRKGAVFEDYCPDCSN